MLRWGCRFKCTGCAVVQSCGPVGDVTLTQRWNRVTEIASLATSAVQSWVLYLGEVTYVLQADISWRWLVKNTCLPQRAVTLTTSEFSKLKEKQRIFSCHAVLGNSCDHRFAWQDRMWNAYTYSYCELVPVNSKKPLPSTVHCVGNV